MEILTTVKLCCNCKYIVLCSIHDLDLLHLQFFTEIFSQRASFSLRVSVMKAKNLMAKDANGETSQTFYITKQSCEIIKQLYGIRNTVEVEDKRVTSHQPTSNRSKATGTSAGSTSNGDAMHDGFNFVQLAHDCGIMST